MKYAALAVLGALAVVGVLCLTMNPTCNTVGGYLEQFEGY